MRLNTDSEADTDADPETREQYRISLIGPNRRYIDAVSAGKVDFPCWW